VEKPARRGKKYKVQTNVARPCKPHWVRIIVPSEAGEEMVYEHPSPIPAASTHQLTTYNHKFSPPQPTQVEARQSTNLTAQISWQPSPCAERYEVYLGKQKEVTEQSSFEMNMLEPCTDYDVSVSAILGSQSSGEAVISFTAPPMEDVMDTVKVDLMTMGTTIMATWSPPASLQCVTMYSMSVCTEGGECFMEEMEGDEETILYQTTLSPCTNSTLSITPVFGEHSFQPYYSDTIQTDCPVLEKDEDIEVEKDIVEEEEAKESENYGEEIKHAAVDLVVEYTSSRPSNKQMIHRVSKSGTNPLICAWWVLPVVLASTLR